MEYFPHDHARSRAYRWGEDGIAGVQPTTINTYAFLAGVVERTQNPVLKERLFGLTNSEGNHGEDVKELYYYLDATPSHSYLKMLYKYPQAEFPYARLVGENRGGVARMNQSLNLLDTGLFDEDRYFRCLRRIRRAAPEDILMLVTVYNVAGRKRQKFPCCLATFFRNRWSWNVDLLPKPKFCCPERRCRVENEEFQSYRFDGGGQPMLLFCDNLKQMSAVFFGRTERKGF